MGEVAEIGVGRDSEDRVDSLAVAGEFLFELGTVGEGFETGLGGEVVYEDGRQLDGRSLCNVSRERVARTRFMIGLLNHVAVEMVGVPEERSMKMLWFTV